MQCSPRMEVQNRRSLQKRMQIFCCDGFQFGHFFTSFPFAIDILRYMI